LKKEWIYYFGYSTVSHGQKEAKPKMHIYKGPAGTFFIQLDAARESSVTA
jgi:hypothetical protein